jgi:hypothetical protein
MSIADFNHEYQAAIYHFEQLVADDPELRKQMLPAHKEEIRIKQKIVTRLASPPLVAGRTLGAAAGGPRAESRGAERGTKKQGPLSGEVLLQILVPLLSVPRPRNLPPPPVPKYKRVNSSLWNQKAAATLPTFDILGLTPAKAINLLRRIMHTAITGHGRYRTITIGAPFSKASPPTLAAAATSLLKTPIKVLKILDA